MSTNSELTGVLNDLIEINNDRIVGYEKAADETKGLDVDLKAIFYKMADESRKYKSELTLEVNRLGGDPVTDETTNSGKIYRVWMDVKATFSGHDRQSVLESCEFGEDAAQKAYHAALASDAEMDADTRQLITSQQSSLKTSHDLIKKYRDMHKAVNA
ncbi:MAG: PA2169 family four-helix-bundle protein [Ferruginibacter sp.]